MEKRNIVSNGVHLVSSLDGRTRPGSNGSTNQLNVFVVVSLEEVVEVKEMVSHLLAVSLCRQLDHATYGESGGLLIGHKVSWKWMC